MHMQVAIFKIERHLQSLALNSRQQSRVHIEIDGVAKFVTLAGAFGFDSSCQERCVMPPERTLSQTAQQITQSLVTEKIEPFFSDLELHIARHRLANISRPTTPLL